MSDLDPGNSLRSGLRNVCWLRADTRSTTGLLQIINLTLPFLRSCKEYKIQFPNPYQDRPVPQNPKGVFKTPRLSSALETISSLRMRMFSPSLFGEGAARPESWSEAGGSLVLHTGLPSLGAHPPGAE